MNGALVGERGGGDVEAWWARWERAPAAAAERAAVVAEEAVGGEAVEALSCEAVGGDVLEYGD